MAITIKHAFTSAKGDGTDATFVQPSNWNASHATSMASGNVIGRQTAGAGAFEELPLSAFMASLLNTADLNTLAGILGLFQTGDVKFSLSGTAIAGWIVYTGSFTIGSANSGAASKSNAYYNLFQVIWNNVADAYCPVIGGRGGSAIADWNANKSITLPQFGGRCINSAGATGGATARNIGQFGGAETFALTTNELPSHRHSSALYNPGHTHSYTVTVLGAGTGTSPNYFYSYAGNGTTGAAAWGDGNGLRVYASDYGFDVTYAAGSGNAMSLMQPFITMWTWIRL